MRRTLVRVVTCVLLVAGALPAAVTPARAQGEGPPPVTEPPAAPAVPEPDGRVRLVVEPGGHAAKPLHLLFTPDGKKLVSTAEDRTIQVWDVTTGERLRVIRPPIGIDGQGGVSEHLVVDRQGQRIAFCTEARDDKKQVVKTTFVCTLATGEAQTLKHTGLPRFAPNGKALAIGDGKVVRLVEIATGTPLLPPYVLPAKAKNNVAGLNYSPDGKTLAVVAGDANVYLLDATTFRLLRTLTVPGKDNILRNVGWADDKTVVCGSGSIEKAIVVLDTDTGELKHAYPREVVFKQLPKGDQAEWKGLDVVAGTTKVFVRTTNNHGRKADVSFLLDWQTGEAGKAYNQDSLYGCHAGAVAPDLSMAAQGRDFVNDVILWDPTTGKPLKDGKKERRLQPAVHGARGDGQSVRWRPDGKAVVWEKIAGGYAELDLTTLTLTNRGWPEFNKYGQASVARVLDGKPPSENDKLWHDSERGLVREWGPLTLKWGWPNLEIAGARNPSRARLTGPAGGTTPSWPAAASSATPLPRTRSRCLTRRPASSSGSGSAVPTSWPSPSRPGPSAATSWSAPTTRPSRSSARPRARCF
jgi:hypothetical protein